MKKIGKWKIGSHPSTVVSDAKVRNTNFPSPPNPEETPDEDVAYYGGYLVCESIGNIRLAHLIAAAPDMLEMLQEAVKIMGESSIPFIATAGGKVFDQERYRKYTNIREFTDSLAKSISEQEAPWSECTIHTDPNPPALELSHEEQMPFSNKTI